VILADALAVPQPTGRKMNAVLYIVAGPLFLISIAGHFYVKLRLRPDDSELDDYYHEFEDQQPGYARYEKWSRITLAGVTVSMLLLFVAAVI
jgi:hypothetical protein